MTSKERIAKAAHDELDGLCKLACKLIAAKPLAQNELEEFALSVLRQAVRERARQVSKELKQAGINEPKRDQIRD